MDAVLSSFALVALSEMGDKTQLLAFSLASRFRSPWKILGGIFFSTLLSHLLAAFLGSWIAEHISPDVMRWVVAVTFIGFGLWTLRPEEEEEEKKRTWGGAFLTSAVLFFFAELGDKTQLATAALAAKYGSPLLVVAGTVPAMTLVNALGVFLGKTLTERVPMKWIRRGAAAVFIGFGIWSLLG